MPTKTERLLTPVELEIMAIVWRLQGATVRDVMAELPAGRELAYTSVSTMLRILEQKGALVSRKAGRGHVYEPRLSKAKYEATSLSHLVKGVFSGEPSSLVQRLLQSDELSGDELRQIRALVDAKLGES